MTNRTPFRELLAPIEADPVRRERMADRRQTYETVLALSRLRSRRGLTQTAVATEMNVSQERVSRIENGGNPQLATLRSYVVAMGGRLEVNAVFPDGVVPLVTTAPRSPTEGE